VLADVTDLDAIITDATPTPEIRAAMDRAGTAFIITRDRS
jgi:hypothetical protein